MFGFLKKIFKKNDKLKFTREEVKVLREFLKQVDDLENRGDSIGPLATKEWLEENFQKKIIVGDGLTFSGNDSRTLMVKAGYGMGFTNDGSLIVNNQITNVNYDETTHKLTYTNSSGNNVEVFTAVPEWS